MDIILQPDNSNDGGRELVPERIGGDLFILPLYILHLFSPKGFHWPVENLRSNYNGFSSLNIRAAGPWDNCFVE